MNRANARLIKSKYHQVDLRKLAGVDQLAAKALIAYLKIIAEINRNPQVLAYSEDPRLNIPGEEQFRVRMGFGLHAGTLQLTVIETQEISKLVNCDKTILCQLKS